MIKQRLKKAKEMQQVQEQSAMTDTRTAMTDTRTAMTDSRSQLVSPIEESKPDVISNQSSIPNKSESSSHLASARYAQETAKQSEDWFSIAQGCKSLSDVKEAITNHLLESNLDQHQVRMTIEYLSDLMTKQKAEYEAGLIKIDDEFNKWTFTASQKDLLRCYLPSVYMSDMNAEAERKFGVKYINLTYKCQLGTNKIFVASVAAAKKKATILITESSLIFQCMEFYCVCLNIRKKLVKSVFGVTYSLYQSTPSIS
jgi:hypothetical protein